MNDLLQERVILTNPFTSQRVRVLRVSVNSTWLYDLSSKNSWPYEFATDELRDLIESGHYIAAPINGTRKVSPSMRAKAKKIYSLMQSAFDKTEELFTNTGRSKWFHTLHASNPSLTYGTFSRYLRLWFAGGCVQANLLTNWDKCGTQNAIDLDKAVDIPFKTAKEAVIQYARTLDIETLQELQNHNKQPRRGLRGRPRENSTELTTLFRVDENAVSVFENYYKWRFEKTGRTLPQAYIKMVAEVFSDIDPLGQVVAMGIHSIPSFDQFKYWYKTVHGFSKRRIAIRGEKNVALNERELEGDETSKAPFAGAIGSQDATIWNVYIRSRFPDRKIIGPPLVYRIRDKRTGMLLGFSVSLENASWINAASAIANCLENKVDFCKKYGLAIAPEDWPVCGLPGTIEADRGETHNRGPERFISLTAVQVTNTPSGRPDIRPGAESDFKTLQVRMNGDTPGALVDRWAERVGDDWKIETVLDIDQFTALLLKHEIARIRKPRKDIKLTPAMIAAGVNGSPLSMWNASLAHEGGGLKYFDLNEVKLSLMNQERGSIVSGGLYFRGIYYTCAKSARNDMFMKARVTGRKKVTVTFDARLCDQVFIENSDWENDYICFRINVNYGSQRDFKGKSFAEVASLIALKAENFHTNEQAHLQQEVDHQVSQTTLIAQAAQQTADAIPKNASKSSQKRGISDNRVRERFVHSPKQALQPTVPKSEEETPLDTTPPPQKNQSISQTRNDEFANVLELFQPSQEKRG